MQYGCVVPNEHFRQIYSKCPLQFLLITYDDEYVNITQKRADLDSSILKIMVRGLLEDGQSAGSAVQ